MVPVVFLVLAVTIVFALFPLVEIARRTSPSRPWAATSRAKTSSYE